MIHLYIPPSLRHFEPRTMNEGTLPPHMCFEYDLVEAMRPKQVVDLGASAGTSFLVFCQSLRDHDIDGFCYAVEMWGNEPPELSHSPAMDRLSLFVRKHYMGWSSLVRAEPSRARRHFDEGCIDILRMDGSRPDLFPDDEVEDWFRKIRPGGVALCYGIGQKPAKELWAHLSGLGPTFALYHGDGLGVVQRPGGPEPKAQLFQLMFDKDEQSELRRFYQHAYDHHELGRVLAWQLYGTNIKPGDVKKS